MTLYEELTRRGLIAQVTDEKEIEGLEKQHRQLTGAKARLGQQMDSLDIMDKF